MRDKSDELLARNPLEAEELLTETFFTRTSGKKSASKAKKPTHYKVCCISLYTDDIEKLDSMVTELKRRGYTKANKSALIRFALDTVDLDKMPKGY
jgi:hypothetical protein